MNWMDPTPDTGPGPQARKAAEGAEAQRWLRYAASQVAELRKEAWVQQALADPGMEAVQSLALVCGQDPSNGDWPALLIRALAEAGRHALALEVARAALRRFALHTGVRLQYWRVCEHRLPPRERLALLRQWLPQLQNGVELKALLQLLPAEQLAEHPCWGVVEYHAPTRELRGWALNLQAPNDIARLLVDTPQGRGTLQADQPHPLLQSAGLAGTGGFRARLPGPFTQISLRFEHGPELAGSPLAALDGQRAEATGFDAGGAIAAGRPWPGGPVPAAAATPPAQPVDILIPVFKGYQATLDCVQSVLQAQSLNQTAHHVVVLDDAGPEPRLAAALQALAAQSRIEYLRHEANLGFIRNMNRGMALHPQRDVVWLNADTRVHGNWLDRLQQAAYAQAHTASATPFSNNGELMGFPEPRQAGPMPGTRALERLDTLATQLGAEPAVIPTGCGFCFYVKRAALDTVGLLDEVHLRRGYGEETDWCLRARQGGWQHVGAPGVFVAHAGGASFGNEKALRVAQNNAVLRKRFPYAERDYQAFVARDPLAAVRAALAQRLADSGCGPDGNTLKRAGVQARKPAAVRLKARARLQAPCAAWVVLDTALPAELGQSWLALARRLARMGLAGEPAARLLTLQANRYSPQWQATGRVAQLPELLGLPLSQRLEVWGAGAAVSLAAAPDAACLQAAQNCSLPVYAPDTAAWRAVGALPLETLPGWPGINTLTAENEWMHDSA